MQDRLGRQKGQSSNFRWENRTCSCFLRSDARKRGDVRSSQVFPPVLCISVKWAANGRSQFDISSMCRDTENGNRNLPPSTFLKGVLNFTPSWFSVNMGTGILSILLHTSPHKFKGEETIGTVLYFCNIILFLLFTVVSIMRYIMFPWAFWRLLRHPVQSLFLGTIPMALATIGNATVIIVVPRYGNWAVQLSWSIWWLDLLLSCSSVIGLPLLMFQAHSLSLEAMTAAWLLPIVPAVVCAASGGLVASVLPIARMQITIFISYVLWGIGMSLSFLVMAFYFHRLTIHSLPNSEVIISAFLPLGPCGQGVYGIIQLAKSGKQMFDATKFANSEQAGDVISVISVLVGLLLWGVGLWWLFHGAFCLLIRAFSSKLKFNIGFWGLIFPLGVFVAGTIALAENLPSAFFSYLSLVLLAALSIMYIGVSVYTGLGGWNRSLLVAPCMSDLRELQ